MTASITRYWRNTRLDLIALLVGACVLGGHVQSARADAPQTDISAFRLERDGEAVVLTTNVRFELSTAVEEALSKGVPIFFVAEVEIFRDRWYWTNKKVVSAERHMRLAYQPLTRRWRLNVASGLNTQTASAVALNQNFEVLSDALAALQRITRWKIADVQDLDPEQRHHVEFRFRLDLSQLPRPFQIGTLGQTDWNISAALNQPLLLDFVK